MAQEGLGSAVRRSARAVLAAVLVLQGIPAHAASDGVQPDAETIYENARSAWQRSTYPSDLLFTVAVEVVQNGVVRQNHYAGEYRVDDGALYVNHFSAEETEHPFTPTGINVVLAFSVGVDSRSSTTSRKLGKDSPPTDYLGVPMLHPLYSFGIVRRGAHPPPKTALSDPTSPKLPTIGSVSTLHRDYDITLIGIETCSEETAYHLTLRPLHDPDRFRLRHMWVATEDFRTLKIITEGNFTTGPSLHVPWTTLFRTVDGAQYVATESADSVLDYGRDRKYEHASIAFEQVRPRTPRDVPALSFHQPEYDDELREPPQ